MAHVIKLHTRPDRVYRGKYPTRMNHMSNGGVESPIVAKHLGIRSPHFVELNNGDRYYIDGFYLQTFNVPTGTAQLMRFDWAPVVAHALELNPFKYNRMLYKIREKREASMKERVAARQARVARWNKS